MSNDTLKKTIILEAQPESVWEFLTDKNKLGSWYHAAESNLEAGKPYTLLEKNQQGESRKIIWGDVLEMQPFERLVQTFIIGPLGEGKTTLVWTLQAVAGGTRLNLEHQGIENASGEAALGLLKALDAGWDEHFGKLRAA